MRSFTWLSGLKSLCGEPVRANRREKRAQVFAAQLELLEERSFPTASSLFAVTEGMTTQSAAADAAAVQQFQQDFTRLVEGLIAAEQGTTHFTNLEKEREWATDKINKGAFERLEKLLESILGEKAHQLQQSGVQAFARAFVMAIQGTSHATTFDEDMNWTVNRANLSRENEVHLNRLRDVLHEAFNEKANDLQRAGIRQFAQAFAAAIQGTSHSTSPGDDYVWARNRASNPTQADLDRLHQVLNEVIVQKEQQLRRSGTLPFANVYAQALRGTSNYASFDKEVSWARNHATSGNTGRLRDVLESSINEMSRKSNATVGTWYARVMSEAGRSADSGWASNMAKRGRFHEVAARVRDAVWSRYDQVPLGSEAGRQEIGNWYASVMSNVGIGQSGDAGWAMWRANRGEFQGHVAKSVRDSLFAKLDSASRGSAASREALSQWYAGIMELVGKGDPRDASWAAHRMERGDFRSHVAKSVDESLFTALSNVGNGNAAARNETARWYASLMEAVGKANPDDGSWARHRINRGDFLSHVAKSVETELFDMLQRSDHEHLVTRFGRHRPLVCLADGTSAQRACRRRQLGHQSDGASPILVLRHAFGSRRVDTPIRRVGCPRGLHEIGRCRRRGLRSRQLEALRQRNLGR